MLTYFFGIGGCALIGVSFKWKSDHWLGPFTMIMGFGFLTCAGIETFKELLQ